MAEDVTHEEQLDAMREAEIALQQAMATLEEQGQALVAQQRYLGQALRQAWDRLKGVGMTSRSPTANALDDHQARLLALEQRRDKETAIWQALSVLAPDTLTPIMTTADALWHLREACTAALDPVASQPDPEPDPETTPPAEP